MHRLQNNSSSSVRPQNVVWLHSSSFSSGLKRLATKACISAGVSVININFACISAKMLRKRTKTKYEIVEEMREEFFAKLQNLNPDFIIINDKASLGYITSYLSLALCRGSIYICQLPSGKTIPCLVVDEIRKINYVKTASWVLNQDLRKLRRWLNGGIRKFPKFEYTVCDSLDKVKQFESYANNSIAMAIDIETSVGEIACSGYACLNKDGRIHTFVIPFIDPTKFNANSWEFEEEEIEVWKCIQKIHLNNSWKILQNGSYDCMYFYARNLHLRNYIGDTLHGFHSIWCELPKRIDFIASILLDVYTYWKDEGKEDAKEDDTETRIPKSIEGMENYWRYNALDCYQTLCIWMVLSQALVNKNKTWMLKNYANEFMQQFGPAFAMSTRGAKINLKLHQQICMELHGQVADAENKLLTAVDGDKDFNPNSSPQLQVLLYDIFKLQPMKRKGRTTNEQILKLIKDQNPFASKFIDLLWEMKKPKNNLSKYGSGILYNNRMVYKMGAGITDTGRYASRKHDFWCGVNVQNIPYIMRPMVEADDGYLLFDIDYAQSDAYFTAFEMEDEKLITNMISEFDVHCIHAEHFFKIDYEKLIKAHKNKEDWCSHNVTGIRSITKRVVYGANYLMAAYTLFITMGRDSVISAAKHLEFADADSWSDAKLIKLCGALLESYFAMYPELLPALESKVTECVQNANTVQLASGRTRIFFGNLQKDEKLQREFAAFFGQGGTAENINKGLRNIYWDSKLETEEGVILLFQVHDSIVGQIPITRLDLIPEIQKQLENTWTIHGRECKVPTEADVGFGWGKRLKGYNSSLTLEEIKEHEQSWWQKSNYKK